MAYCLKYTLEELNCGISKEGKDTKPYTVARLGPDSNFHDLFKIGVDRWMGTFGNDYLKKEWGMFQELRKKM
jgi:hypothetical protein